MVSSGAYWIVTILSVIVGVILGIWLWVFMEKKKHLKQVEVLKEMARKEVDDDGENREGEDAGEDRTVEKPVDIGGREEEAGGYGDVEVEPFDPDAGDEPILEGDVRPNSSDFA